MYTEIQEPMMDAAQESVSEGGGGGGRKGVGVVLVVGIGGSVACVAHPSS